MQCKHPRGKTKILCAQCVHFVCSDCMIRFNGLSFCSHACISHYKSSSEPFQNTAVSSEINLEGRTAPSSSASKFFALLDYTSDHPSSLSTNIIRGTVGLAASAFIAVSLFTGSGDGTHSPEPTEANGTMHTSLKTEVSEHKPLAVTETALIKPLVTHKAVHAPKRETVTAKVVSPAVEEAITSDTEEAPVTHPVATVIEEIEFNEPVITASLATDEITEETTVLPGHMVIEPQESKGTLRELMPLFLPDQEIELFDIDSGIPSEMKLSITFDGGSLDNHANEILDALARRGITTTIFLAGQFITRYPDTVKRILAEGHEVANHTRNHPHLTSYETNYRHNTLPGVTREFLLEELRGAELAFTAITGERMSPYWRAPYGEVNIELIEWAADEGYIHVGWTTDHDREKSLDTLDWVSDKESYLYLNAEEITDRILSYDESGDGLRGGIVLMHLGSKRTTDRFSTVLGDMIDTVREKGYKFVKVSELFERKRSALRKKAREEETLALKNSAKNGNFGL